MKLCRRQSMKAQFCEFCRRLPTNPRLATQPRPGLLNAPEVAGLCISFRVRCELRVAEICCGCLAFFVQAQPVQPMQPLQPAQTAQPAPAPHLQEDQPTTAREVRRVLGGWDSPVRAVLGPCMSRNIHRSFADTIKLAVFAGPTCVCH